MTFLEINTLIKRHNNKLQENRRNMFTSAKLLYYAFHNPSEMPNYEDWFEKKEESKQVNEAAENIIAEETLKYFFDMKKNFV